MNSCAGGADLPDFESGPFNHLGTSPDKKHCIKPVKKQVLRLIYYSITPIKCQEIISENVLIKIHLNCDIKDSARFKDNKFLNRHKNAGHSSNFA